MMNDHAEWLDLLMTSMAIVGRDALPLKELPIESLKILVKGLLDEEQDVDVWGNPRKGDGATPQGDTLQRGEEAEQRAQDILDTRVWLKILEAPLNELPTLLGARPDLDELIGLRLKGEV